MSSPDHDEIFWDGPVETVQASKRPGVLKVGVDGSSIVCCTIRGRFELAMAERIMQLADEVVERRGEVLVFAQSHGMESYEQVCRVSMTKWAVSLGPKLVGFHVVGGTTLVRMGVTVASMFVGQLKGHDTVEDFLRAYEAARSRNLETSSAG